MRRAHQEACVRIGLPRGDGRGASRDEGDFRGPPGRAGDAADDRDDRLYPPTGYKQTDARTSFFYAATGITPAMAMRLTDIGSQYLFGTKDGNGDWFDGAKTYKVTLPKGIPAKAFWSFTLYDNQTRSMLKTPQKYPRAGSQAYPSPAAEVAEDGSTTIWFAPEQPEGVARGIWIQTDPEKGWVALMRLYSPTPAFFDTSWQPSEVMPVQ